MADPVAPKQSAISAEARYFAALRAIVREIERPYGGLVARIKRIAVEALK